MQRYQVQVQLVDNLTAPHIDDVDEIEFDVKRFVMRHQAMGSYWMLDASLPELIAYEVKQLGFERVRLRQVAPHPVWNVTARLGRSLCDCDRSLKLAIKRMARKLGFKVKLRDVVASVYRGRVQAVFCLDERIESSLSAPSLYTF